jgi:hypothetical protein
MQRDLGDTIGDFSTSKSLEFVLSAMEEIEHTWSCVTELRTSILQELQRTPDIGQSSEPVDNSLAASTLDPFGTLWGDMPQFNHEDATAELGPLITDDFLTGQFSWDDDTMT